MLIAPAPSSGDPASGALVPANRPEPGSAPLHDSEPAGEALPLYLQEIGRVPLLSGPEEVELAQGIERGLQAAERLRNAAATDPDAAMASSAMWPTARKPVAG